MASAAQKSTVRKRKAILAVRPARAAEDQKRGASSKAMSLKPVNPSSLGLDAAPIREYEHAMQDVVRQGITAGAASVVFYKGQVVQAGSWGYADLERGTKFRADTFCRLYCMTKSYVAVTFMSLVDEGRASLEDRLDKYLPEFANMSVKAAGGKRVKAKSPILLKHLLSHSSGIDYAADPGAEPEDSAAAAYMALQKATQRGSVRTLKEFVQRLSKLPLSCHPGCGYYYGYSLDVLAHVVELIMGKRLDECLRERVFDPLGMHDTLWAVPDSQLHRLAAVYGSATTWGNLYGGVKGQVPLTTRKGLIRFDGNRPQDSHWREGQQCSVLSGGGFMGYLYGGLVSTVADTAKFVKLLLDNGLAPNGLRILKERTVALMEADRLKPSWGSGRACYIGNKGVFREANEYGMGGAACTYWSIDRADGVATVWFSQNVDFPEYEDMEGVDGTKADLWKVMHQAVLGGRKAAGAKRPTAAGAGTAAKRPRGQADGR
mmetsp:Transcript_74427/g.197693  ORF Transcript_74427/g.197693 Transcript_74427/m.197693 type:complete len:489 (-) Transcript_74427:44-1510(-)|eukprot:CAMPEP_0171228618 /NCGR_PEP_ID=MMETSP0790-20130122/38459_1 /TAXON_ID=2925 /ORGANISM="Alexandrium catenella, Strain OF101" /LENGTH=488 /DNA_ID=CAMNT_0011694775 /DNA_START=13 /DNA_END=1479 /DNA_ORIENTATION=+